MRTTRSIGISVFALATTATILQAEVLPDKYAPLIAALSGKRQAAVAGAKDARFWAEEYGKIIEDPDTDTEEKLALRKTHILEQARARTLIAETAQLDAAIRGLRGLPVQPSPSVDQLRDAYKGLDDLGAQGRSAWEQVLADRDASVEALKNEYARALGEAEALRDELKTEEVATQYLLDATNNRRLGASDEEFRVALKLPSIKSAVEFGFGITVKPEDHNAQAQTTLLALVGYSQFFWDHHSAVRDQLGEGGLPADRKRNIFGVPDGDLLMSKAIEKNDRRIYFLSSTAKENFNRRIRAIWGADGSIAVSRWNEDRAGDFFQACQGLATTTEQSLVPNPQVFRLLIEIDAMIERELAAVRVIQEVHTKYEGRLAEATKLGDKAALSSAHYNAQIWARDSTQAIARFEAARRLLDQQLTASADETWTPDGQGIAAGAEVITSMHDRFHSVMEVKRELAMLLQ